MSKIAEAVTRMFPFRWRGDPDRRVGEGMVQWLSPLGLFTTGVNVLLSGVFSRYADKRELIGTIQAGPLDLSRQEGMWIDFVADTGDGWAPTYAVAWAVCRDQNVGSIRTSPGDVLVFGGDEVYPSASFDRYRSKVEYPYRIAARGVREDRPILLAIPGNHDWYDGLTDFMRTFSLRDDFAIWRARQSRSYFAVRLAEHTWMLGLDIGFGTYIDAPQQAFFEGCFDEGAGEEELKIRPGDRIILCTGKPTWASRQFVGDERIKRHSQSRLLETFERMVVSSWGCELPLVLSGDLHHYARYEIEGARRQRVTAGGGGAYLFPTHGLPDELTWPDPSGGTEDAALRGVFPGKPDSRGLRKGIIVSPFRNRWFLALAGFIHVLIASQVVGGIQKIASVDGRDVTLSSVQSLVDVQWSTLTSAIFTQPLSGFVAVLLLLGLFAFVDYSSRSERIIVSIVHWMVHVTLIVLSMLIAVRTATRLLDLSPGVEPSGMKTVGTFSLLAYLVFSLGAWMSGFAFSLYLWAQERRHRHANDAFSAIGSTNYKSFVRLKLGSDESIDLFAFGLPKVPRPRPLREEVESPGGYTPNGVTVELIEGPIPVCGPFPRDDAEPDALQPGGRVIPPGPGVTHEPPTHAGPH